jgi:hypothetical protein
MTETRLLRAKVNSREGQLSETTFTGTRHRAVRKSKTDLQLVSGERDINLLSSAIREWIVPVLVRDFLTEHPITVSKNEAVFNNSTTGVHGEEGAGSTRMNSHAR